jgi:hypothetical protein
MKRIRRRPTRRSTGGCGCLALIGLALALIIISQGSHQTDTAGPTPNGGPTASVPADATPPPTAATLPTPLAVAPTSAARVPTTVATPDPRLTPGATFGGVTAAQVCTSGWATAHRHVVAAQYRQVYGAYGIPYPEPSGTYELDHLIPLELGGDNANANLWPEAAAPTPGFHQKDDLENALHDRVCAGSLALAEAQRDIALNWYAAYIKYVVG